MFETYRRNVKRRTECFSEEFLRLRWHTVSFQNFINEIHLRAAIDRFLCLLPPFSNIRPRFYRGKQRIRAFAKDVRKTGNIADLIEPIRNAKKH